MNDNFFYMFDIFFHGSFFIIRNPSDFLSDHFYGYFFNFDDFFYLLDKNYLKLC